MRMGRMRNSPTRAAIFLLTALATTARAQTFSFDFDAGQDLWEGGYSDYSDESDFQFQFARAPLPEPLDTARHALKLSGMNRSDDLFMFLRRRITGLVPSAGYDVVFRIRFASKYATDGAGIGGSPGRSVFLKAGATAVKPVDQDGRMNIDKGNQSQPGPAMDTLGNVAVAPGTTEYATIERTNAPRKFPATTAPDGSLWLIVGTDSGFEGLTTLYYQSIEAVFTRQGGTPVLRKNPKRTAGDRKLEFRVDGRATHAPLIIKAREPRTRGSE
jgi:hypothetical protein